MGPRLEGSMSLQRRAARVMPLGVNSNVRYHGEGKTLYIQKAKGAHVWDVDGTRYIDFRLAFGPIILGHAYDMVDAEVAEFLRSGVCSGFTTEKEVEVAETVVEMCPCVERVRIVNTGTEAGLHAVRLARAYTGRERLIKFEGAYHGNNDYLLFTTYGNPSSYGSRNDPIGLPASSGIPRGLRDLITTLPFNDMEMFERTVRDRGHEIAAVIAEPMLNNYGSAEPRDDFLKRVAAVCGEWGILFILDDVKTGFRVARGGGQELYQVRPDLAFYTKAMGNGYPIAAFGGRAEVMDLLGRGVSQGGTYCGNGAAIAAASATLKLLRQESTLRSISELGRRLQDGIGVIFARAGIPHVISGHPALFGFAVGITSNRDAREWAKSDHGRYEAIADGLLSRGVLIDPDPREPLCVCLSHTKEDVDDGLNALEDAVRRA